MILEVKNLSKRYASSKLALDDVNLSLDGGHIVGLFGPNGSGKTTFIKILSDLLMSYNGEVLIDNKKVGVETKKLVSYLPDVNYLEGYWTIDECINVFKRFYDDFDENKCRLLLSKFPLNPKDKIKTLSKGNKEKVQLILVLSRNAKVFLFDEPIAGVDPASREIIFDLILEYVPKDALVIITTHLIRDIENFVDHVIFINEGKIFYNESKEDMEREFGDKTINDIFIELFKARMMGGIL